MQHNPEPQKINPDILSENEHAVFAEKEEVRKLTHQQEEMIAEEKKNFADWKFEKWDVSAAIVLKETLQKLCAGEVFARYIEPGDSPIYLGFEETDSYQETPMRRPE